jgi:hypothetical protein
MIALDSCRPGACFVRLMRKLCRREELPQKFYLKLHHVMKAWRYPVIRNYGVPTFASGPLFNMLYTFTCIHHNNIVLRMRFV